MNSSIQTHFLLLLTKLKKAFFIAFLLSYGSAHTIDSRRLIVLIDEQKAERLDSRSIAAVTSLLDCAIHEQSAPVLLTRTTLLNYVARRSFLNHPKHPENNVLKNSPFYTGLWRIFKVNETQYYLLLPTLYLAAKKAHLPSFPTVQNQSLGFNFSAMLELSLLLPKNGDFYRELRQYLQSDTSTHGLEDTRLFNIFASATPRNLSSSWNIYIAGHGSVNGSIAGTQVAHLNRLLEFFNTNLNVNLVYIMSCFLGGSNKYSLTSESSTPYHFYLVLGSITDCVAVAHYTDIKLGNFFIAVEKKPAKSADINTYLKKALKHITTIKISTWSRHGMTSVPQVCRPGEKTYAALALDETIVSLRKDSLSPRPNPSMTRESATPSPTSFTNTPLKSSQSFKPTTPPEESTEPPQLLGKLALLLYEMKYDSPLNIAPTQIDLGILSGKHPFSNIPTTIDLLTPEIFELLQTGEMPAWTAAMDLIQPITTSTSACNASGTQRGKALLAEITPRVAPPNALFPVFISMIHHQTSSHSMFHHFAEINVSNRINGVVSPFMGLLHFLRDAFLDASHRKSKNIFLVDALRGFNDFSIFFELFKTSARISPFEKALQPHVNQHIILHNVLIQTEGRMGAYADAMEIKIAFHLDGQAWSFSFFGTPESFCTKNSWLFELSRTHSLTVETMRHYYMPDENNYQ
jgi:hypothetical protein